MKKVAQYFSTLNNVLQTISVTDKSDLLSLESTVDYVRDLFHTTTQKGHKLIFIGNGGSAAIASHMAIDYTKNGGMRAIAFNDPAMLTCLSNDLGYQEVFARQLQYYATTDDVVIIISSSGNSRNIIRAADIVRNMGNKLITLSGFEPSNRLRQKGDINFYVAHDQYGPVEIAHLTILHAILDIEMGFPHKLKEGWRESSLVQDLPEELIDAISKVKVEDVGC